VTLDVAIVNYNTDFYLHNLLCSIRDRLPLARIARVHVWDNGSSDGSLAMLRVFAGRAPWLRIYRSPVNLYHGPALDRLLRRHCTQPWVLLLDSDTEILGDFFPRLPPLDDGTVFVGQLSAAAHQLYPFLCHLLLNRDRYLRLPPFRHHGAPGIDLFRHVESHGLPYRRFRWSDWVRHYGQGTLRAVYAAGETGNDFYDFARREAARDPAAAERREREDRFRRRLHADLAVARAAPAPAPDQVMDCPPPAPARPRRLGRALRAVARRVPGARRLKRVLIRAVTSEEDEAVAAAYAVGMNQRPREIRALYRRVRALRPRVVLDIGTGWGGTLRLWTRAAHPEATVISLDVPPWELDDPWEPHKAAMFRGFAGPGQTVHLLRMAAYHPGARREVLALLGGRPIDFLFIDGDRAPGGAPGAFEEYAPLVRAGGLVALHDIRPWRSGWAAEVPTLWAALRARYPSEELVQPAAGGGCGIGLLRV
jgi:predicted O-methyltransferase YrrM